VGQAGVIFLILVFNVLYLKPFQKIKSPSGYPPGLLPQPERPSKSEFALFPGYLSVFNPVWPPTAKTGNERNRFL